MVTKIDLSKKKIKKKNFETKNNLEILILNLSFNTKEDTIRKYFNKFGNINKINMLQKNNNFKGKAYIVFNNYDSIELLEKEKEIIIDNRYIKIIFFEKMKNKENFKNKFNSVFLKNLPYDIKEEDINKLFNKNNDIKEIRLMKDKQNKGKGIGFIDFNNSESCELAVEFSPYIINNRNIYVEFTKNNN